MAFGKDEITELQKCSSAIGIIMLSKRGCIVQYSRYYKGCRSGLAIGSEIDV